MVMRSSSNHLVRCDLCNNATHNVYKVNFGGNSYKFCSGIHANKAYENYMEKLNKGITPEVPDPVEEDSAEGDNITDYI